MMLDDIQREVHQYVLSNFVYNAHTQFSDDQSLSETGVIDSTGILELITFVEKRYQIRYEDDELVADNFDSVKKVASSVERKFLQHRSS